MSIKSNENTTTHGNNTHVSIPSSHVSHTTRGFWQDDEEVGKCNECREEFNFLNRKHHCRICGLIFCDDCAPLRQDSRYTKYIGTRCCKKCWNIILHPTPRRNKGGTRPADDTTGGGDGSRRSSIITEATRSTNLDVPLPSSASSSFRQQGFTGRGRGAGGMRDHRGASVVGRGRGRGTGIAGRENGNSHLPGRVLQQQQIDDEEDDQEDTDDEDDDDDDESYDEEDDSNDDEEKEEVNNDYDDEDSGDGSSDNARGGKGGFMRQQRPRGRIARRIDRSEPEPVLHVDDVEAVIVSLLHKIRKQAEVLHLYRTEATTSSAENQQLRHALEMDVVSQNRRKIKKRHAASARRSARNANDVDSRVEASVLAAGATASTLGAGAKICGVPISKEFFHGPGGGREGYFGDVYTGFQRGRGDHKCTPEIEATFADGPTGLVLAPALPFVRLLGKALGVQEAHLPTSYQEFSSSMQATPSSSSSTASTRSQQQNSASISDAWGNSGSSSSSAGALQGAESAPGVMVSAMVKRMNTTTQNAAVGRDQSGGKVLQSRYGVRAASASGGNENRGYPPTSSNNQNGKSNIVQPNNYLDAEALRAAIASSARIDYDSLQASISNDPSFALNTPARPLPDLALQAPYSLVIAKLSALPNGDPSPAQCLNASSHHACCEWLRPGLLLTHINDVHLCGVSPARALDMFQRAQRPIHLRFIYHPLATLQLEHASVNTRIHALGVHADALTLAVESSIRGWTRATRVQQAHLQTLSQAYVAQTKTISSMKDQLQTQDTALAKVTLEAKELRTRLDAVASSMSSTRGIGNSSTSGNNKWGTIASLIAAKQMQEKMLQVERQQQQQHENKGSLGATTTTSGALASAVEKAKGNPWKAAGLVVNAVAAFNAKNATNSIAQSSATTTTTALAGSAVTASTLGSPISAVVSLVSAASDSIDARETVAFREAAFVATKAAEAEAQRRRNPMAGVGSDDTSSDPLYPSASQEQSLLLLPPPGDSSSSFLVPPPQLARASASTMLISSPNSASSTSSVGKTSSSSSSSSVLDAETQLLQQLVRLTKRSKSISNAISTLVSTSSVSRKTGPTQMLKTSNNISTSSLDGYALVVSLLQREAAVAAAEEANQHLRKVQAINVDLNLQLKSALDKLQVERQRIQLLEGILQSAGLAKLQVAQGEVVAPAALLFQTPTASPDLSTLWNAFRLCTQQLTLLSSAFNKANQETAQYKQRADDLQVTCDELRARISALHKGNSGDRQENEGDTGRSQNPFAAARRSVKSSKSRKSLQQMKDQSNEKSSIFPLDALSTAPLQIRSFLMKAVEMTLGQIPEDSASGSATDEYKNTGENADQDDDHALDDEDEDEDSVFAPAPLRPGEVDGDSELAIDENDDKIETKQQQSSSSSSLSSSSPQRGKSLFLLPEPKDIDSTVDTSVNDSALRGLGINISNSRRNLPSSSSSAAVLSLSGSSSSRFTSTKPTSGGGAPSIIFVPAPNDIIHQEDESVTHEGNASTTGTTTSVSNDVNIAGDDDASGGGNTLGNPFAFLGGGGATPKPSSSPSSSSSLSTGNPFASMAAGSGISSTAAPTDLAFDAFDITNARLALSPKPVLPGAVVGALYKKLQISGSAERAQGRGEEFVLCSYFYKCSRDPGKKSFGRWAWRFGTIGCGECVYYKSEFDAKPQSRFSLRTISGVRMIPTEEEEKEETAPTNNTTSSLTSSSNKKKYVVEISLSFGKVFMFSFQTIDERNAWYRLLSAVQSINKTDKQATTAIVGGGSGNDDDNDEQQQDDDEQVEKNQETKRGGSIIKRLSLPGVKFRSKK